MNIYYDTKTGNVQRFINKLQKIRPNWHFININSINILEQPGHLVTFTTGFGDIPNSTYVFLNSNNNFQKILSASSSGNMNWGLLYGKSIDIIYELFSIPSCMKFELSGTNNDIKKYISTVENFNAS